MVESRYIMIHFALAGDGGILTWISTQYSPKVWTKDKITLSKCHSLDILVLIVIILQLYPMGCK
jgi:hypothetical protein